MPPLEAVSPDPFLSVETAAEQALVTAETSNTHDPHAVALWRTENITPTDREIDLAELEAVKPGSTADLPPDLASAASEVIHDARRVLAEAGINPPVRRRQTGLSERAAEVVNLDGAIESWMGGPRQVARERAESTKLACEVRRTPEVDSAIDGYFQDHYTLAEVVKRIADGSLGADQASEIASGHLASGNYLINQTLQQLSSEQGKVSTATERANVLLHANHAVTEVLFNETAIGSTGIAGDEAEIATNLLTSIREEAVKTGLYVLQEDGKGYWKEESGIHGQPLSSNLDIQNKKEAIFAAKRRFWDDTRRAGQLEFHNTPHMDEVARGEGLGAQQPDGSFGNQPFSLAGRSARKERGQGFHATSRDAGVPVEVGGAHSNLVHFSEGFTPIHYKTNERGYDRTSHTNGTVAVPLAEIITQAPYARDAQYGIVEIADARVLDRVPVNATVYMNGNPGGHETQGRDGGDRVFLADYRDSHQLDAHNYVLAFGGDRSKNSRILLTEDERGAAGHVPFGAGEGYVPTETVPFTVDDFSKGAEERLQQKITTLVEESCNREEYEKKIVVPLRAGVVEFRYETMDGPGHNRKANIANSGIRADQNLAA
jgi:hypothetical protein